ncbi:MAG TPA: efflux transporter outer membrane subunit [Woeseiaceae bacterium]|nr:efflux transporter outer membrane subunit [Woeseiaceae bacterium]
MGKSLLFVVLGLLGACQLAPEHIRPALPTEAGYPTEYSIDQVGSQAAHQLNWHEVFVDPKLEVLVETALVNNRDMQVAVLRIDEARAAYRIQHASRLPSVSGTAGAQRGRTSIAASGVNAGVAESYTAGFAIPAFELDFWGRVHNLSESALRNYLATVEAARAFQLSLARDVALTYLATLEAEERIALAERTVQARSDQLRIAHRRLDAGVTSELEFRQAETLLTQAQAEMAGLRLTHAQTNNLLTVLIGGPLGDDLPMPHALANQVGVSALSAGLPSNLLESRPDIRASEESLIAARANIGAARAAFFPSIQLTGNTGYASTELDALIGEDGRAWTFGPSINLPIFDFGRRRASLDVAKAREHIAVARYEQTVQTAFREVADALAGRRYLAAQVAAQERGVVAQRRLSELAQKRYSEGVVRYLEVLDAERSLFAAEQALLQVRRIEAGNHVALYIALGGNPPKVQ